MLIMTTSGIIYFVCYHWIVIYDVVDCLNDPPPPRAPPRYYCFVFFGSSRGAVRASDDIPDTYHR